MIERFSDKDPAEIIVLTVDFVDVDSPAVMETITSCNWFITREDLPTEDTSAMKIGSAAIVGFKVSQKVAAGTVGGSYIHRVEAVTATRTLIFGVRQNVTYGA